MDLATKSRPLLLKWLLLKTTTITTITKLDALGRPFCLQALCAFKAAVVDAKLFTASPV